MIGMDAPPEKPLHCFQKKSPSGVRTARTDIELIHERLKTARADYEVRYAKKA
jgi:hypothetical protein